MIRFLTHDQIDPVKWDYCISKAYNGNLYGNSWFLDLVCPEWCALVEDDYQQIMPLPSWQKYKVKYIAQPYYTQQLGLYSQPALHAGVLKAFLQHIPKEFRYIDMNLNTFNNFETSGFISHTQVNYELDLVKAYTQISGLYSDNLKRNLRKAGKHTLSISENCKPEVIVDLFRKNRGARIRLLADKQYALLLRLIYSMIQRGKCKVWGCFDRQNQLVAGVVWVYSHQKAVFLFSAVSEQGRNEGAIPWMIDAFIREHAGKQVTLDFEGSNDEALGRFYAGFGSEKVIYQRVYKNDLSLPIRISLKFLRRLRNK